MPVKPFALAAILLGLTLPTALGLDTGLTITLGGDAMKDFQRRVVLYNCDVGEPFHVDYIDAAPNFIALLPVEQAELIFSSVQSDTGARYVASHWVWWTKGAEARLYDLNNGADAAPVNTCSEVINTP